MERRDFIRYLASVGGSALALAVSGCRRTINAGLDGTHQVAQATATEAATMATTPGNRTASRVALVRADDRAQGVKRAMEMLELDHLKGQSIFLKPNFNSADPAPGSTHNDTLAQMIRSLKAQRTGPITVGDRSGMGDTRKVMEEKDIFKMAEELGFETLVFDDIEQDGWTYVRRPEHHWSQGFAFPTAVLEADAIIQTCCLKTHRFGGHFTMALKNTVGFAAKHVPGDPHDYMGELHRSSHMRQMIAELNGAYRPALIVLEGVEAFVKGGPDKGELARTRVIIAGTDPVAIDALGVAVLRDHGTTSDVARGPVFKLDQIARAAELGLGASNADSIEILTDDAESNQYAARLNAILAEA